MKYILLLYHNAWPADPSPETMAAWAAYTAQLQEAGVLVDAAALHPTDTASTVRRQAGATVTKDGPFAETKEQLGGYYIVDVPSREEAAAWAAQIPSLASGGSVEVRPVMDLE